MKILKQAPTVLLVLSSTLISTNTHAGLNWVPFTVARHANTTFTDTTFDAAMNVANERMQLNNHSCTVDVPCAARYYRSGAVGTFGTTTDGLDVITTQAELDSVFGVNAFRIKVVTGIDWCAGGYNPSIVGCGRCNAFGFIFESGQPGNVYVHEYGHNVLGCGHRDDCNWNIMNTYTNGQNNAVNATECTGLGGHQYTELCGDLYDGAGGPLTVVGGPYWLTCDVTVPSGRVLTIQPGVEIQFEQGGLKITSPGLTVGDGSTGTITIFSNNAGAGLPSAIIDSTIEIAGGGVLQLN